METKHFSENQKSQLAVYKSQMKVFKDRISYFATQLELAELIKDKDLYNTSISQYLTNSTRFVSVAKKHAELLQTKVIVRSLVCPNVNQGN